MIIKNKNRIATGKLRKQGLDIIAAGIKSVLPSSLLKNALKYDPRQKILSVKNDNYKVCGRIFVIGGGKASGAMAEALESIINPAHISAGTINCQSSKYQTKKIKIIAAGHPLPNQKGIQGVKQMLSLKSRYSINKNDLIICLISGGGSALMTFPAEGIRLKDLQAMTKLLLSSGAKIEEINVIRKQLSRIKGGKLACFFAPAAVVSLIISDVIGNKLESIASGLTFPNPSTPSDAHNILKKYNLLSQAPKNIVAFLTKKIKSKAKKASPSSAHCHNYIIGDNRIALKAMAEKAKKMGFNPHIITAKQSGEPTKAAKLRAKEILRGKYQNYDLLLVGGETSPKLPAVSKKGGRNQHYVAASILAMKKYPGQWVIASVNTDGSDFLENIAGAIADDKSLAQAKNKGLDIQSYLDYYNTNALFKKISHSLIVTGQTGTNVSDIMVYILK